MLKTYGPKTRFSRVEQYKTVSGTAYASAGVSIGQMLCSDAKEETLLAKPLFVGRSKAKIHVSLNSLRTMIKRHRR